MARGLGVSQVVEIHEYGHLRGRDEGVIVEQVTSWGKGNKSGTWAAPQAQEHDGSQAW